MFATSLVFLTLAGITIAAILAFGWAARSGQFRNFDAGARSVFDPDEPEGATTDSFPGKKTPMAARNPSSDLT